MSLTGSYPQGTSPEAEVVVIATFPGARYGMAVRSRARVRSVGRYELDARVILAPAVMNLTFSGCQVVTASTGAAAIAG